jgi:hypothetical protein
MTAMQSVLGSRSFRCSWQDYSRCTVYYSPSVNRRTPTLAIVRFFTFRADTGFCLFVYNYAHNFKRKNFRPSLESNFTLIIFSHKMKERELNCFCVHCGFDLRNITTGYVTAELCVSDEIQFRRQHSYIKKCEELNISRKCRLYIAVRYREL